VPVLRGKQSRLDGHVPDLYGADLGRWERLGLPVGGGSSVRTSHPTAEIDQRNSATILIADRKGRKELARRAIRKPQGAVQKRLGTALVGAPLSRPQDWLNAYRRELLLAALLLVILFATWLFLHHGPLGM
jgi:sensor histidine kinase regulating citrate/malate metabolism